jgi:uncharacterized pyridoxal phosphate-containing UPF0001 family protein
MASASGGDSGGVRGTASAIEVEVARNLDEVRRRIAGACADAGRLSASITLIAVSKGQPLERIEAALAAGQRVFGENYVQ